MLLVLFAVVLLVLGGLSLVNPPVARPFVTNPIRPGPRRADIGSLREFALAHPAQFHRTLQDEIDAGRLRWSDLRDLKALYRAFADVQIETAIDDPLLGRQRAIMASSFPLLVGGVTIAAINDAYQAVPTIGQLLVEDIEDPRRISVVAALRPEAPTTEGVEEGHDFPEVGAGVEEYLIRNKRDGLRLSITQEAIEQNAVPDIVQRVNMLGSLPAKRVEKQTLRRVTDKDGSATSPAEPYVLRPNGTGTALFSATANTPGTRAPSGTRVTNNALADETDLENARTRLASMKDDLGDRIALPASQCVVAVPDALLATAARILNSELTPGVANELNPWGPRGQFRPALVSSALLDDLSTTAWYYGAPRRQFKRKWAFRFEYVTLGENLQAYLQSRIAFQARVAWDCEIGATDYVYWVQNLSGTTAP